MKIKEIITNELLERDWYRRPVARRVAPGVAKKSPSSMQASPDLTLPAKPVQKTKSG